MSDIIDLRLEPGGGWAFQAVIYDSNYLTLAAADAVAVAAGRLLVISTNHTIDDTTLTSPVWVLPGVIITINAGETLTINGSFEAGLYQVFAGTGTVTFGESSAKEVYPQWWGAVGDGTTNDTTNIQRGLNSLLASGGGRMVISNGSFAVRNLEPKTGTEIEIYSNANFIAHTSIGVYEAVISLNGVDNVTIKGGTIDGNRSALIEGDSEFRHCIQTIGSCENITIKDIRLLNADGDNLYISEVINIVVDNVYCDNSYRNGLSITDNCYDVKILNSIFTGAVGTNPQGGIDIEPNTDAKNLDNIVIDNCSIYGNTNYGIAIFNFYTSIQKNIVISNCYIHDNGEHGIGGSNGYNLTISNCRIINNNTGIYLSGDYSNVKILSCHVAGNNYHQLYIKPEAGSTYGVDNVEVIGGDYLNSIASHDGIYIYNEAGKVTKNVKIIGVTANDNQLVPTQRYGINLQPTVGQNLISSCVAENNVSGDYLVNGFVLRFDDISTGWTVATGTAARTTFDTATVTLEELAKRVKALIDDTFTHGIIGT